MKIINVILISLFLFTFISCGDDPKPDKTKPIITLIGSTSINIIIGSKYTDLGATALDNIDGDITNKIVVINPVDTTKVGKYTITYNVEDVAGNKADEITRIVNVKTDADIIKPVITLNGESSIDVTQGRAYIDLGATALDDIDGDITKNIITVNPVNTMNIGEYIITYNVADSSGNLADEVRRVVNVIAAPDTTRPVITLIGNNHINVIVGEKYTDLGATASDDIDGDITNNIVVINPVDINVIAEYVITYNVKDASNNEAIEVTRTVNVKNREYGLGGEHDITIWEEPTEHKSVVYYPSDITSDNSAPVIFFAPGWRSTNHEDYETLLKFIASKGYLVVYIKDDTGNFGASHLISYAKKAIAHADIAPYVDTTKIGVIGHSSGGGHLFKMLKEFVNLGWGDNGRFIFSIEPWFSFDMTKDDMKTLANNTNVVIQQYGIGGNNDISNTDARIPLTEFYLLESITDEKKDYQVFTNADHDYPKGNGNYTTMQNILKPLDALMYYTFVDSEDNYAHDIALEVGNDNPYNSGAGIQIVKPMNQYNYQCDGAPLSRVDSDINYCAIAYDETQKVFIIGDSTVHIHPVRAMDCGDDNPNNLLQGWGDSLNIYMKYSQNSINQARHGSNSVDFVEAGTVEAGIDRNWIKTKEMMENANGGILLIQFGSSNENRHTPMLDDNDNIIDYNNDGVGNADDEPARIILRKARFKEAVGKYINEARALKVTPILVTPPEGRSDINNDVADGVHINTRGDFPDYLIELATTYHVDILDLHHKSNIEFAKYSDSSLLSNFGDCTYNSGYIDRVHYEPQGANKVAGWLKGLACSLEDKSLCTLFSTTEDHSIPTISLNGSYHIAIVKGENYTELGATALDDFDGDITNSVVVSDNINNLEVGNYEVKYNVKDAANNEAIEVIRYVDVINSTMMYEDADDNDTNGWNVYTANADNSAIIKNIFDNDKNSRVIELSGPNGTSDGFRININEQRRFFISWDMKYDESFTVYVHANTTEGEKYFMYRGDNNNPSLTGAGNYRFGIGDNIVNNGWKTISRDLKADMLLLAPNNKIISIREFLIRGSGKLDNIKVSLDENSNGDDIKPVILLNGSANIDINKGSQYNDLDATATDNIDGDITNNIRVENLVDTNVVGEYNVYYRVSDLTGNSTFITRIVNVIEGNSENIVIHEDAEDGDILNWGTYGIEAGSVITNIFDNDRNSKVISLSGNNGIDNGFYYTDLNITEGFVVSWSIKYNEDFKFYVKVKTTSYENLYIYYTPEVIERGFETIQGRSYLHNAIGVDKKDGTWKDITRDIKADLKRFKPNENLEMIYGFYMRGSGLIDDIKTSTRASKDIFRYNGHRYEIIKAPLSWQDASNDAHIKGGYLAHISSKDENDEIYSRLYRYILDNEYQDSVSVTGGGATYIWIGANDKVAEGVWHWEDDNEHFWTGLSNGNSENGLFYNWGLRKDNQVQREPDNWNNSQDVAAIALTEWQKGSGNLGQTSQWNDLIESEELFYIIEYDNE